MFSRLTVPAPMNHFEGLSATRGLTTSGAALVKPAISRAAFTFAMAKWAESAQTVVVEPDGSTGRPWA